MLFFDYEKIYVLSCGKSKQIVQYIKLLKHEPLKYKLLNGNSFILNEDIVVDNPLRLSDQQLAEYLGLLSLRSYDQYLLTSDSSLDMENLYPWIPREVVETNPLIAINQSKLIFIKESI